MLHLPGVGSRGCFLPIQGSDFEREWRQGEGERVSCYGGKEPDSEVSIEPKLDESDGGGHDLFHER